LCGGGGRIGGIFYLPTVRIAGTFFQLYLNPNYHLQKH